jgi:hypothetical protein
MWALPTDQLFSAIEQPGSLKSRGTENYDMQRASAAVLDQGFGDAR